MHNIELDTEDLISNLNQVFKNHGFEISSEIYCHVMQTGKEKPLINYTCKAIHEDAMIGELKFNFSHKINDPVNSLDAIEKCVVERLAARKSFLELLKSNPFPNHLKKTLDP